MEPLRVEEAAHDELMATWEQVGRQAVNQVQRAESRRVLAGFSRRSPWLLLHPKVHPLVLEAYELLPRMDRLSAAMVVVERHPSRAEQRSPDDPPDLSVYAEFSSTCVHLLGSRQAQSFVRAVVGRSADDPDVKERFGDLVERPGENWEPYWKKWRKQARSHEQRQEQWLWKSVRIPFPEAAVRARSQGSRQYEARVAAWIRSALVDRFLHVVSGGNSQRLSMLGDYFAAAQHGEG